MRCLSASNNHTHLKTPKVGGLAKYLEEIGRAINLHHKNKILYYTHILNHNTRLKDDSREAASPVPEWEEARPGIGGSGGSRKQPIRMVLGSQGITPNPQIYTVPFIYTATELITHPEYPHDIHDDRVSGNRSTPHADTKAQSQ